MPKAKTTKTKPNKTHNKKSKKIKILVAIAIILLAFIGISATIEHLQQKELERKFAVLEEDVNQARISIIKSTNIKVQESKYCKRDVMKYGAGPLRCFISLNASSNEKHKLINTFEKNLNRQKWTVVKQENLNEHLASSTYKNNRSNINCRLSLADNIKGTPEVEFSCFDRSNDSFYPYRGD